MYCTKCGTKLEEQHKFCCECGTFTGQAPKAARTERLSRMTQDAKLGGVCAGFARYFGVDVTLVRVLWLVFTIWPLPLFGIVSYIVAWIVMPKDTATAPAREMHPANGSAS